MASTAARSGNVKTLDLDEQEWTDCCDFWEDLDEVARQLPEYADLFAEVAEVPELTGGPQFREVHSIVFSSATIVSAKAGPLTAGSSRAIWSCLGEFDQLLGTSFDNPIPAPSPPGFASSVGSMHLSTIPTPHSLQNRPAWR